MIITKENIHKYMDHDNEIICPSSNITSIEYIPEGVELLDCECNELTTLPKLPDSLKRLYCYNNKLTSYPNGSNDIQWFKEHNKRLKLHNRSETIKKILSK